MGKYGTLPLIQSTSVVPQREFKMINELTKQLAGNLIWVRARLHASRARGKQCFAVLRQREFSVQALVCVGDAISKQMVKFCSKYVVQV